MRASCVVSVMALAASACGADLDSHSEQDRALIRAMRLEGRPGDVGNEYVGNDAVAVFGQQLFFDDRLSAPRADGSTMACVDCHQPALAFSDKSKANVSRGVSTTTMRNALPLANVGFYRWWGWDGRADSLWGQGRFAYESPRTMAGTPQRLVSAVHAHYRDRYESLFHESLLDASQPQYQPCPSPPDVFPCAGTMARVDLMRTYANLLKALGAYLSRLVSSDAPIDRYAAGEVEALTDAQKRGLRLFIGQAGCVGCHWGPHFTDNAFYALGLPQAGPDVPPVDPGRALGLEELAKNPYTLTPPPTPRPEDVGAFRTKSLRNVALTGPYFHAGQADTLKDVVWFYNQGGDRQGPNITPLMVPLGLSDTQQADLVSFLEALTGQPVAAGLSCDNSRSSRQPKCAQGVP
ncbi:MAG: cytochrome c peroxidase [Myxococcota bacterium]